MGISGFGDGPIDFRRGEFSSIASDCSENVDASSGSSRNAQLCHRESQSAQPKRAQECRQRTRSAGGCDVGARVIDRPVGSGLSQVNGQFGDRGGVGWVACHVPVEAFDC